VALIAYFQWRTAHQRIVFDIFERRLVVFNDIEEAVKHVINDVSRKELEAPFWRYVRAEAKARFLFGADVINTLAERRADIADVMAFSDLAADHSEYQQLTDRKYQAIQRLVAFVQTSSLLFAPYMRMDQKMPSVWWPIRRRRH
jgi:hypothetical protein